jgi:hypothetical protein
MSAQTRKEERVALLLEQEHAAGARLGRIAGRGKVEASSYPLREEQPPRVPQIRRRFWNPEELQEEPAPHGEEADG